MFAVNLLCTLITREFTPLFFPWLQGFLTAHPRAGLGLTPQ